MALEKFTDVLGTKNAAHLLRRTTFGITKADIDTFATKTPEEAFTLLTAAVATPSAPIDAKTGASWLPKPDEEVNSEGGDLTQFVKSWWLHQMYSAGANMKELMVFLMHTFYPTVESAVEDATALYYQNALFRFYAYGNLKTLTKKVSVDNAMLLLLDGRLNEVDRPNENFARELFELHTIGKGEQTGADNYTNYTEADIKMAARILSGWTNDPNFGTDTTNSNVDTETGIPLGILKGEGLYASRHDASNDPPRKFTSAFDNTVIAHLDTDVVDGKATKEAAKEQVNLLVDMIFAKRATAENFCRKIYRFFVYYDITTDAETNVIQPLADTMVANSYEILPVVKELLTSKVFYDANNTETTDNTRSDIIKSPLELSLGGMKYFGIQPPSPSADITKFYEFYGSLLNALSDQGISLYEPYDVAGYDAYHQQPDYNRNWITVNTLAFRYDFCLKLGKNTLFDGITIDFAKYVKDNVTAPETGRNIVQHFVDYLLPETITSTGEGNRFDYFLKILLGDLSAENWTTEWNSYLSTGMGDMVNSQLEDLIAALLQTPEYQLM